jgi:hypothetical protein
MKPVGSISKWVACGIVMAALFVVSSAEAAQGKAVVRSITGTAQYSEKGGTWQTLTEGKVLGPGTSVKTTSAGSQAGLYLAENGPDLTVTADTTVGLDQLEVNRNGADTVVNTHLDLRAGTIRGRVNKLAAASKYEVRTPQTVFGIRPTDGTTEYQISADGRHTIIDGSAVVVYTNPTTGAMSTHTINEGQTFVPGPTPVVRPTQKTDFVPIIGPGVVPPGTPVVVIPQPVEFVSPGTGLSQ